MSAEQKPIVERHDICLALDVRSYERIVVFTLETLKFRLHDWWEPCYGTDVHDIDAAGISDDCVVLVDQLDLTRKALARIMHWRPRLIGMIVPPGDIEYERIMRRNLTAVQPWSEVWKIPTTLGWMLFTAARGKAYDRDEMKI